jgi:uncharacterized protein YjbI with pentapeptide repeats
MASPEHLAILKQGVSVWNEWRKQHDTVSPDLDNADLQGLELGGAKLSGADLRRAALFHADLSAADLSGADLIGANLIGAILSGATLSRAKLSRAKLSSAKLVGATLIGANLIGANLSGANLNGADLSGADLHSANLRRADLFRADLSGADLGHASLTKADLRYAILIGANLTAGKLVGARLVGADLSYASLIRVDLAGADLGEAQFLSTCVSNCDLRLVSGLDRVEHRAPSSVSIDTVYESEGQIPEAFLLGCGVHDSFITQIPALIGALQPIQFYSCFISYSTKDEDFARRLHERMRREKLRVWFAPEDVQGGKKLHEQIERAIQFHDRLLLVLSENSIHSEWVMTEIRNARKVELKDNRRKLFPIRLCPYEALRDWKCFDGDSGKDLAVEVREYFIPDFSNWKNHDDFESAFARLLRDLRASES